MSKQQALLLAAAIVFVVVGACTLLLSRDTLITLLMALGVVAGLAGFFSRSDHTVPGAPATPGPGGTPTPTTARLRARLDAGFFGGLSSGAISGPLMAFLYIRGSPMDLPEPRIYGEVLILFGFGFACLGVCCQLFIDLMRLRPTRTGLRRFLVNEVTGGVLGGAMAGILAGPMLGWYFGRFHETRPFLPADVMFGSAIPVGIVLGFSIAYFGSWRPSAGGVRNGLVALSVGVVLGVGGIAVLDSLDATAALYSLFYSGPERWRLVVGGITYAATLSALLGAMIGLSAFLSDTWDSTVTSD